MIIKINHFIAVGILLCNEDFLEPCLRQNYKTKTELIDEKKVLKNQVILIVLTAVFLRAHKKKNINENKKNLNKRNQNEN